MAEARTREQQLGALLAEVIAAFYSDGDDSFERFDEALQEARLLLKQASTATRSIVGEKAMRDVLAIIGAVGEVGVAAAQTEVEQILTTGERRKARRRSEANTPRSEAGPNRRSGLDRRAVEHVYQQPTHRYIVKILANVMAHVEGDPDELTVPLKAGTIAEVDASAVPGHRLMR